MPGLTRRVPALAHSDVIQHPVEAEFAPHRMRDYHRATIPCSSGRSPGRRVLATIEAMSRMPPNVGALAFKRTGDPNLGNYGDATVLKTYRRGAKKSG